MITEKLLAEIKACARVAFVGVQWDGDHVVKWDDAKLAEVLRTLGDERPEGKVPMPEECSDCVGGICYKCRVGVQRANHLSGRSRA